MVPVQGSLLLHEKIQDERNLECIDTYFCSSGQEETYCTIIALFESRVLALFPWARKRLHPWHLQFLYLPSGSIQKFFQIWTPNLSYWFLLIIFWRESVCLWLFPIESVIVGSRIYSYMYGFQYCTQLFIYLKVLWSCW